MAGDTRYMLRAALFLAVALLAQALRFVLPLPPLFLMIVIGTIVNMCLCLAVWKSRLVYAGAISFLLPLAAFAQGHLGLAPMIGVVFLGNLVLCLVANKSRGMKLYILGPLLKTIVLWGGVGIVAGLFNVPRSVRFLMQLYMSWPQFITALLGIIAAKCVLSRTQNGAL